MAPFLSPRTIVTGIKEKIDSLLVQGDRLYLGSSVGNLHIYGSERDGGSESENAGQEPLFKLVEMKKGVTRRAIEQLGFIKDVNSLVVLSEMTVTLFPLPSLSPPTPLAMAKAAFSFAVYSSVQSGTTSASDAVSELSDSKSAPIPTLVTYLLVGCRRKAVLYTWKDGEPQEVKEALLPHSARSITFLNPDSACFAYSPTEYAIFTISTMTAVDIVTPLPTTASTGAMGALTGLTGYMTLGLLAKPKPASVHVNDSEVLIAKDVEGFFIGHDAKPSRSMTLEWPVPPEEVAAVKPYIISVLPAGTVQNDALSTGFHSTSVVQIHSSLSLQVAQTIPFPFDVSSAPATSPNATLRLLTTPPSANSPLYLISAPTDRTAAATDGSSIWEFTMKSWPVQLDELVLEGHYADALALLGSLDESALPDKLSRRTRIRALYAVSQFRSGKFDEAIDTFIELDFNPAKVVALYPEAVSGRLSVSQDKWIPLYGGPVPIDSDDSKSVASNESGKAASSENASSGDPVEPPTTAGSFRNRLHLKTTFGLLIPGGGGRDDDTVSISSKRKVPVYDDFHRSIETLVRFLTDRRPKLFKSLAGVQITPQNQTQQYPPLSKTSVDELFELPDAPLSALTPEQLLRFAQIIDTALYKAYLIIRPTLLSSLCRVANWCEVSELEEDLRKRKKFSELKDLYHGKGMHDKALELLKEIAVDEDDLEDKLGPSIRYLQKLGTDNMGQIFESARWIIDTDKNMAFDIFISEDVDLPHRPVADYLEKIDPRLCIRYLEHLLYEKHEESSEFHDRLAGLYFSQTMSAKKRGDDGHREEMYSKLLQFVDSNQHFGIDRLYGMLSSTDLFEARAILLGRLGRHDQALELYVYRLHDYRKAEDYCKRVYQPGSGTSGIYLTLLRIYLRPTSQAASKVDLLKPALALISRHSPRLDSVETLQLLPPLVTAHDVKEFLVDALRVPVFDTRVIGQISKARNDHLARKLVGLQTRRVKVTDTRICPQCHKRIGNSVIAVHSPHGEVTHYQCREPFSQRIAEMRR
ncbi:hypothetical protein FA15DRAFT_666044 [Coprinopsis marcescibilis]|uniref:CNH domain-containing protein n=1 Tax=Coprinopsis marcescibilis TaxID=230819 RepID=A0A5C3L546_COPMA|nr:hypothetical protein FA15DRAFT_666044 [Coprinopsis marcescibilis]